MSEKTRKNVSRRGFFAHVLPLAFFAAVPAYAVDLFKLVDPEGKNKDLSRVKDILKGAGDIAKGRGELDYASELAAGQSLALEGFARYGLPVENQKVQDYLNLVTRAVARYSQRPGIPYHAVLVDSGVMNAFSCPGGIIFLSKAMFTSLSDEAELACIMAHEVGHVASRHAVEMLKRAKVMEGITRISGATLGSEKAKEFIASINELKSVLFDRGLDQNMEFEADRAGMETAYRTGYNPEAFLRVLDMLETKKSEDLSKSGSWFSTHPPLPLRIAKCREEMKSYPDAKSLARPRDRFIAHKKAVSG